MVQKLRVRGQHSSITQHHYESEQINISSSWFLLTESHKTCCFFLFLPFFIVWNKLVLNFLRVCSLANGRLQKGCAPLYSKIR